MELKIDLNASLRTNPKYLEMNAENKTKTVNIGILGFGTVGQGTWKHLEENNLLPNGQHGFRAFRSTLTQLLSYWDTILGELEQGHGVDVIYTDFSKALPSKKHAWHTSMSCGSHDRRRPHIPPISPAPLTHC